jgi:hypothetical protein
MCQRNPPIFNPPVSIQKCGAADNLSRCVPTIRVERQYESILLLDESETGHQNIVKFNTCRAVRRRCDNEG